MYRRAAASCCFPRISRGERRLYRTPNARGFSCLTPNKSYIHLKPGSSSARTKGRWSKPLLGVQWACDKLAWHMTHWSVLQVLSYAETFSILIAPIFWVAESHERTQQKHYQAWQVINTAQGKGGSGGRLDALEQLNEDRVPLVGVDASEAFLQDVRLDKAELRRATFRAADLRRCAFPTCLAGGHELHIRQPPRRGICGMPISPERL